MEELVILDLIDPNPYQPREKEDPEHVQKIADSIAADGLMQVPVGRRVGDRVQLAFGHSRLAAFKLLAAKGYSAQMPVYVRDLTDEEMFRMGIGENLARKDLTPLEEARAMARYRDEFKKTSAEIGGLFGGLSDSAVRNKIRLLELPEDIQAQMAQSPISELAARELVTLYDLPEDFRKRAEENWQYGYEGRKPSDIVHKALAGEAAEEIHGKISRIIASMGRDLSAAPWKHDQLFAGEGIVGLCKGCQHRIQRDKAMWCIGPRACYGEKNRLWEQEYLTRASLTSGVPIYEGQYRTEFSNWNETDKEALEIAKSSHCENLRLKYEKGAGENYSEKTPEGYPDAMFVCQKRMGYCTCLEGVRIREEMTRRGDPGVATEAESTPDELKVLARQERQRKRQDAIELKAILEDVTKRLAEGLEQNNRATWARLIRALTWNSNVKPETPVWEIRAMVAEHLAERIYSTTIDSPNLKYAFQRYNEALKEDGLEEMVTHLFDEDIPETVSTETVDDHIESEFRRPDHAEQPGLDNQ